jgi:hypothetical protein
LGLCRRNNSHFFWFSLIQSFSQGNTVKTRIFVLHLFSLFTIYKSMNSILLSLLLCAVVFLFNATTSFSQSQQAIEEASTFFKVEGPKLCTLTEQFQKLKEIDKKIKTLDDIFIYFQSFWNNILVLNSKYPELGDLTEDTSPMKAQAGVLFECVGNFQNLISEILDNQNTDEKFKIAFDTFSKNMDSLSTEYANKMQTNAE